MNPQGLTTLTNALTQLQQELETLKRAGTYSNTQNGIYAFRSRTIEQKIERLNNQFMQNNSSVVINFIDAIVKAIEFVEDNSATYAHLLDCSNSGQFKHELAKSLIEKIWSREIPELDNIITTIISASRGQVRVNIKPITISQIETIQPTENLSVVPKNNGNKLRKFLHRQSTKH